MRDNRYDIVKGMAITLMVIGHAGCYFWLRSFIYLFHMAVFFIAAGWFYRGKYNWSDVPSFVLRRITRLWVPFVGWTILFMILHNALLEIRFLPSIDDVTSTEYTRILYQRWDWDFFRLVLPETLMMQSGNFLLLAPLWFLQVLAYSLLGHYALDFCLQKLGVQQKARVWILALTGLIMIVLAKYFSWHYWLRVQDLLGGAKTMTALGLFELGALLHFYDLRIDRLPRYLEITIGLVCGLLLLVISRYTTHELCSNEYSFVVVLLATSAMGWFFLSTLAGLVKGRLCQIFAYIGRHTMPILILHVVIFRSFTVVINKITGYDWHNLYGYYLAGDGIIWWASYSVLSIAVALGLNAVFWRARGLLRRKIYG